MTRDIDLLTSPALTHLRDRWWDAAFTTFVRNTLQPQPGERVLEVGCGAGIAELMLGLLQSQVEPGLESGAARASASDDGIEVERAVDDDPAAGPAADPAAVRVRYFGIDLNRARLRQALGSARDHRLPLDVAAADARRLPFADAAFDATFAVGVLQHVPRAGQAIDELARVTRPDGRVLLVEPDNAHRYWFSSVESGMHAFDLSRRFFAAHAREAGAGLDRALGPHLPSLCRASGIDAIAIHLFPVAMTRLGAPVPTVWQARRGAVARVLEEVTSDATRTLGRDLLDAIERYAEEGSAAGAAFVEIQHTMLFAVVGHRRA